MRLASDSVSVALLTAALAACSSAPSGAVPFSSTQRADVAKTLYIADPGTNSVTLFPADVPSPAPIATISDGVNGPNGIAVDRNGTLYVANSENKQGGATTVTEYPAASNKPSLTINTPFTATSVAVDSSGNVYVGGANNGINVYSPGSKTPSRSISGGFSQFFAVGKDGSLYDPTQSNVLEFAPGANNPDITFKGSLVVPEGAAIH